MSRSCARAFPLLFAGLLWHTACNRAPRSDEQRAEGLYLRTCAGCHGPYGRGPARLGFDPPPAALADPGLQRRLDDAELARIIREGKGQMPGFGRLLSEEEVQALVQHLRRLPLLRQP